MTADTRASRGRLNRESVFVLAVGVAAGVGLASWGLSPTGSSGTDAVVLVAGAVAAIWCGSSAPWWLIVVVAATGGLLASGAAPLALSLLAIVLACLSGLRPAQARWAAPIAVALVVAHLRPHYAPTVSNVSWRERFDAMRQPWQFLLLFIVTIGGIYGKVVTVSDNCFNVEIANNVVIKCQRSAVSMQLPKGTLKV